MTKENFDRRWEEVKRVIQFLWEKVSDYELESSQGNIETLIRIINEKYHEEPELVRTRLEPILMKLSEHFDSTDDDQVYRFTSTRSDEMNRDISAI